MKIRKPNNLLKGNHPDIVSSNIQTLKNAGYSHASATRCAMCHANKKHPTVAKRIAKAVTKKTPMKVRITNESDDY